MASALIRVCCPCLLGKQDDATEYAPQLTKWSDLKARGVKAGNFVISGQGTVVANAPLLQTRSYFEVKVVEDGCKKMAAETPEAATAAGGIGGATDATSSFCVGVAQRSRAELDKQLVERETSNGCTFVCCDSSVDSAGEAAGVSSSGSSSNVAAISAASSDSSTVGTQAGGTGVQQEEHSTKKDKKKRDKKGKDGSSKSSGNTNDSDRPSCIPIQRGDVIGCSFDLSGVKSVLKFYKNGNCLEQCTQTNIRGEVYPACSVHHCTIDANFGQRTFEYAPPAQFDGVIFCRDLI